MTPRMKMRTAICQAPWATKNKLPVIITPMVAKNRRNFFRAPPWSAIAPRTGARATTTMLAMEFAKPKRKVLVVTPTSAFQYFLKNNGKKPAMTVVAKAEFAQSYRAQETTFLLVIELFFFTLAPLPGYFMNFCSESF